MPKNKKRNKTKIKEIIPWTVLSSAEAGTAPVESSEAPGIVTDIPGSSAATMEDGGRGRFFLLWSRLSPHM